MTSSTTGYDLVRTCPLAEWQVMEQRTEFRIPGLPPCGIVENDTPDAVAFGWNYAIHCRLFEQHRRGRRDDLANCLREAMDGLESLGCTGQVRVKPPC